MSGYQYTLIKYVHNDASGECVNVGLAMFAPERRWFRVRFNPRYSRIKQFFSNAFDADHYRNVVRALSERFDHLTASLLREERDDSTASGESPDRLRRIMESVLPEDSTVFRWGPLCGGVTRDVDGRFDALFSEFVTRHDKPTPRQLRQESQMWSDFERLAKQRDLDDSLKPYTVNSDVYQYEFHGSFRNGKPNVIEPISLDLQAGENIVEKATQWTGRLVALSRNQEFALHAILAPPSDESLRPYFDKARDLLGSQRDIVKHLIVEREDQGQLEDLLREIHAAQKIEDGFHSS